jgi:2-oxoglutarate ferredoxin oxidoreductase subunit gamma
MTIEVRLSGSGGQGIIFIGRILAEAAGVFEGKNAVQSSSYGGQVRGGSSRSDVLISPADEEIDFPEVLDADILLAMNQEAADEYSEKVKHAGVLPTNVVVLAVISQVGELVGKEALVEAIKKRGPRGKEEMNLQALNLGFELLETGALETRS